MGSAVSKSRSTGASSPAWLVPLSTGLFLLALFASLNTELMQRGFSSKSLLYLGEKALLVFQGRPPRLENLGFVYPPLPYLFVLVFRNVFWAAAFVGSLSVAGFFSMVWGAFSKGYISSRLLLMIPLYVVLCPLCLFLLTQQIQLALLVMILMQAYFHLYRYLQRRLSFDLFAFGLLTGLLFYTQFLTIFVIPLLLYAVVAGSSSHDWKHRSAVFFVGIFPAFFFTVSWGYLNWIFMKDPLYFLKQWHVTFDPERIPPEVMQAAYDSWHALKSTLKLCIQVTPLILPYWAVLFALLFRKTPRRFLSFTVLATPPWLLYLLIAGGQFEFHLCYFILFLPTAFLVRIMEFRAKESKNLDTILVIALAVSLFSSFWFMARGGSPEERLFLKGISGKECGNLALYKELLAQVDATDPGAAILLDDTRQYPLVFLDGNPKRFILPYEYEYETVLAAPELFVDYLVLPERSVRDRLAGKYPLGRFGYVDRYQLVGKYGDLLLFRKTEEADQTVESPEEPRSRTSPG